MSRDETFWQISLFAHVVSRQTAKEMSYWYRTEHSLDISFFWVYMQGLVRLNASCILFHDVYKFNKWKIHEPRYYTAENIIIF